MNFSGQIIIDELSLQNDQMDNLELFFMSKDFNVSVWKNINSTLLQFDNFSDSDKINSIFSEWIEIKKGELKL